MFSTYMFHSFFNSLAKSRHLSFFSLSFNFTLWSAETSNSTIPQFLLFFFVDYYKVWLSGQDKVMIIIIIIITICKFFTLVFTEDSVTTTLLRSPGIFKVFLILTSIYLFIFCCFSITTHSGHPMNNTYQKLLVKIINND